MLSDAQRAAYRFLRERAMDEQKFTAGDIEKAAAWGKGTFTTFKTKHLKEHVTTVGRGDFKVEPHFLRLTEEDFDNIVSQSRKTIAKFVRSVFDAVLRYEFLLPLTNERKLRSALDELFYKDHLLQRAREIGKDTLVTIIPAEPGERDEVYTNRVVEKVASLLGGYSIGHVHGRFRAGSVRNHEEAALVLKNRGRYLVDETTAVVRFILPIASSKRTFGKKFDVTKGMDLAGDVHLVEIDLARRLFIAFFVESVIFDIHAEDEIWFLESSPSGERLYVLEREPEKVSVSKFPPPQLALFKNPLEAWLRENGYAEQAERMNKVIEGWKKENVGTRRNWWDIFAGDVKGQPREVAGETFPIIAAIRKRQGLDPVKDALSKPGEKPPPPKEK